MESNWFDYIKENPDKDWNYNALSLNPNITWEIVQSNPDKKWNYHFLSLNNMTKDPFFQNKQLTYILK